MYKDQNFVVKLYLTPGCNWGQDLVIFLVLHPFLQRFLILVGKRKKKNQMSLQNKFELIVVGIYNVLKEKRKEL